MQEWMSDDETQSSQASSTSSFLVIPQTAPEGGLTITQPPQTATSFYKIAPSVTITFGWNFTNVLASPTSLTVSAVADNGNTYPVGPTDGIIPGNALSVEWDIGSYQGANPTKPLAPANYILTIWDDRGPTARLSPGRLAQNNALHFALYTGEPYTALSSGWECAVCQNGAMGVMVHPTFLGIVVTFLVMLLSGFHLIMRTSSA